MGISVWGANPLDLQCGSGCKQWALRAQLTVALRKSQSPLWEGFLGLPRGIPLPADAGPTKTMELRAGEVSLLLAWITGALLRPGR